MPASTAKLRVPDGTRSMRGDDPRDAGRQIGRIGGPDRSGAVWLAAAPDLELGQLTAFLTNAAILASSAAVSFVSPHDVGHMLPSSSFASSLKPNVA